MEKTSKTTAPEATQKPSLGISDDPTILAIVSDMVQSEESKAKRAPRGPGEPEVLRRAHPSLLLLDTPHRFI
jgi:DNA-binding response OmpR family regulator